MALDGWFCVTKSCSARAEYVAWWGSTRLICLCPVHKQMLEFIYPGLAEKLRRDLEMPPGWEAIVYKGLKRGALAPEEE